MNERRIFSRIPLPVPVIINDTEPGEIINISVGGLCLTAPRPDHISSKVRLKFVIPGSGIIELKGHVVWYFETT